MTVGDPHKSMAPKQLRLAARQGNLTEPTSGLAPGFVQCNLVIIPQNYASDFADFCRRNIITHYRKVLYGPRYSRSACTEMAALFRGSGVVAYRCAVVGVFPARAAVPPSRLPYLPAVSCLGSSGIEPENENNLFCYTRVRGRTNSGTCVTCPGRCSDSD